MEQRRGRVGTCAATLGLLLCGQFGSPSRRFVSARFEFFPLPSRLGFGSWARKSSVGALRLGKFHAVSIGAGEHVGCRNFFFPIVGPVFFFSFLFLDENSYAALYMPYKNCISLIELL
jgi:hypothetical protein